MKTQLPEFNNIMQKNENSTINKYNILNTEKVQSVDEIKFLDLAIDKNLQ